MIIPNLDTRSNPFCGMYTKESGPPFCSPLLSSGHYEYACPTQDDFRWQISTVAAMGAKSLAYFYVNGVAPHDNDRQFPINCFNERTRTFEWLSYEIRLFQQHYGDIMLTLTPIKPAFAGKIYGGIAAFAADEKLRAATAGKGVNLLVT